MDAKYRGIKKLMFITVNGISIKVVQGRCKEVITNILAIESGYRKNNLIVEHDSDVEVSAPHIDKDGCTISITFRQSDFIDTLVVQDQRGDGITLDGTPFTNEIGTVLSICKNNQFKRGA